MHRQKNKDKQAKLEKKDSDTYIYLYFRKTNAITVKKGKLYYRPINN